jgi:hypothetical protein
MKVMHSSIREGKNKTRSSYERDGNRSYLEMMIYTGTIKLEVT